MHVSETGTPGLPQDSLSKAIEAASKVNALLIASGKLKPSVWISPKHAVDRHCKPTPKHVDIDSMDFTKKLKRFGADKLLGTTRTLAGV